MEAIVFFILQICFATHIWGISVLSGAYSVMWCVWNNHVQAKIFDGLQSSIMPTGWLQIMQMKQMVIQKIVAAQDQEWILLPWWAWISGEQQRHRVKLPMSWCRESNPSWFFFLSHKINICQPQTCGLSRTTQTTAFLYWPHYHSQQSLGMRFSS